MRLDVDPAPAVAPQASLRLRIRTLGRRTTLLVVIGALAVAVAAAVVVPGSGASSETVSAPARLFHVTVRASEFKFVLSREAIPTTGVVEFTVLNVGAGPHDFKILGTKTKLLQPGRRATLRIEFAQRGRYGYSCTLPGQARRGMRGVFNVGVGTVTPARVTGLDFPGSSPGATTMRFQFANPQANGLPIYGPGGRGVTYIWKAYPRQQHGYYTTFFWGNDGDYTLGSYYGFHPYPQGDGTAHRWEIAGDVDAGALDILGGPVVYNRWYTQVARVWSDAGTKHLEFFWNWPDRSKVIAHTIGPSGDNTDPPNPVLVWGDAPWPSSDGIYGPSGQGNEVYDGVLRGIQIYNDLLSYGDIASEIKSPLSTRAGSSSIWYLNLNPTPTDISDKSGKNHDPSWVGRGRPGLYRR